MKLARSSILFLTGSALATFASVPAAAQKITYNTYLSASDVIIVQGLQPIFERITKDTGGKVTFQIFPGGQMVGAIETLNGVRDGVVDSGFVYEAYQPKALSSSALFTDMVGFNQNSLATIAAVMETRFFNCPECLEEFTKSNVIALGGHATAPSYLMCNREIKSLDDLKGLRVRASQRYQVDVVKAFGGTPVNINFNEHIAALERGSIDCGQGGIYLLTAYGLKDIIKSVITTEHFGAYVSGSTFAMRLDLWKTLTPDVKQAIIRAMPDFIANSTIGLVEQAEGALKESLAGGKVKTVDLGQGFRDKWQAFLKAERGNVITFSKERGMKNPEILMDAYLKNYAKWETWTKEIGNDRKKFSQKLWDEIYSRVNL